MIQRRPIERHRVVAMGLLLAILLLMFVGGVAQGSWLLIGIGAFFGVLIGVLLLLIVGASKMAWSATWHDGHVEVVDRRWGKERRWSAPYGDFEALRVRRVVVGNAHVGGLARVHYAAELVHSDPLKTVLVAASPREEVAEHAAAQIRSALSLSGR